ncbi:uncharacterized protein DS421_19g665040 [Arachis hypogaea]|uniref:Uncharacterized protein n=1 Tax=Arachis hypogaea TaxID=3818 RepID=A0A6B9VDW7_ARAHY|nr:uncharacterized protein DS421_19g665040 [Arachis hypogaea]
MTPTIAFASEENTKAQKQKGKEKGEVTVKRREEKLREKALKFKIKTQRGKQRKQQRIYEFLTFARFQEKVPPPSGDEGSAASPAPPVSPGRTRQLRPPVPTSRTRQLRPPQQISSEIDLQFQGRLLTRHGGGEDIKGRSPQATRRKPGKKEPQNRGKKDSVPPRVNTGGQSVERVSRYQRKDDQGDAQHLHLQQGELHGTPNNKKLAQDLAEELCKKRRRLKRTDHVGPPQKNLEKKDLPISTDDDEENEPLAKRMCRLYNQGVDQQKPSAEPIEGNLNQDKGTHETPVSIVPDVGTLSVVLVQHEEWDNPNFLSNRDPESERIWQYLEQLQNTRPLQTVMPTTPSCMTPSPPSKEISPCNTRTEQKYTQCTPIKVHPLLKGRKLDEDDEEQLRRWAANGSLEQSQVVASYEGRQHLSLIREDICSLLLRHWVTSNIVQWMRSTFNDSESLRFKDDFYCISLEILKTVLQKRNLDSFREISTVSYVGLGPHFGDDSRFFDKIAASM